MLRDAGYDVIVESSSKLAAALDPLAAAIDTVVSDVVMPGLTGPEVVAALRASGFQGPVLYVSGYTAGAHLEAADGTASDVLPKPFTPSALLAKLRALEGSGG